MAKPRIFVSSTYYDLKYIRNSIESFITSFGYEPILFENGDIPFHHDHSLDISCYEEIKGAHIFILIIGGRYGSRASEEQHNIDTESEFYNSITKKEYESARNQDIPIYIFVEKNVLGEYSTYRKNRENSDIRYAHVDNINIFRLLDEIYAQTRNNLVKDFEHFDDISNWLREQWAGLFADFLSSKSSSSDFRDLSTQIDDLKNVNSVLREYTENILKTIIPTDFEKIVSSQKKILEDKKRTKFFEHPLIDFLQREMKNIRKRQLSNDTFYKLFQESSSLDNYLASLGFKEQFIEEFLVRHGRYAERDYAKLKEIE